MNTWTDTGVPTGPRSACQRTYALLGDIEDRQPREGIYRLRKPLRSSRPSTCCRICLYEIKGRAPRGQRLDARTGALRLRDGVRHTGVVTVGVDAGSTPAFTLQPYRSLDDRRGSRPHRVRGARPRDGDRRGRRVADLRWLSCGGGASLVGTAGVNIMTTLVDVRMRAGNAQRRAHHHRCAPVVARHGVPMHVRLGPARAAAADGPPAGIAARGRDRTLRRSDRDHVVRAGIAIRVRLARQQEAPTGAGLQQRDG